MTKDNIRYCYHGTSNKKIAMKILKEGFKPKTYFARHLEDALEFGGKYVFRVAFVSKKLPRGGWQFWVEDWHAPNNIVSLEKYDKEIMYNQR